MASPESPSDAANEAGKPSCGAVGQIFLQTFVSSWIAAKSDRATSARRTGRWCSRIRGDGLHLLILALWMPTKTMCIVGAR